jgi:hypothetical protein
MRRLPVRGPPGHPKGGYLTSYASMSAQIVCAQPFA